MKRRTATPALVVLDLKEAVITAAVELAEHPEADDQHWTLYARMRDTVEQLKDADDVDYTPAGEIPGLDDVTALAVARLEEVYRRA